MRGVSAISGYLESARKGKREAGGAARGKGESADGEGEEEGASYGLLERLQAIRQTVQAVSFSASIWQIDLVQRRLSHIYNDPAVITAIGLGADRRVQAPGV